MALYYDWIWNLDQQYVHFQACQKLLKEKLDFLHDNLEKNSLYFPNTNPLRKCEWNTEFLLVNKKIILNPM